VANPRIAIQVPTAQPKRSVDQIRSLLRELAQEAARTQQSISSAFNASARGGGAASPGGAPGSARGAASAAQQTVAANRRTAASASDVEKALIRQERAAVRAREQGRNLANALRSVEGEERKVAQITRVTSRAVDQFTEEMNQGVLSTRQFSNAQNRLTTRLGASRRAIRRLETQEATRGMRSLNEITRDLSSSAVLAVGPLSGIGARIVALGAIANRSALAVAGLFGALSAGIVGLVQVVNAGARAQSEIGRLRGVLRATGKDAELTAEQVRGLAEDIAAITPGGTVKQLNDAAAAMLTFGNVGEQELRRLLPLAVDLSESGLFRLNQAARDLGAALESPAEVVTRLSRVVASLRGELGDSVRELEEQGRTAEATEVLLSALENRVSGLASEVNVGLNAALGQASQEFRRISEELAQTTNALATTTTVVQTFADFLTLARENIEATSVAVNGLLAGLGFLIGLGVVRFIRRAALGFGALATATGLATAAAVAQINTLRRERLVREQAAELTLTQKDNIDALVESLESENRQVRENARARVASLRADIEQRREQIRGAIEARDAAEESATELEKIGVAASNLRGIVLGAVTEIFPSLESSLGDTRSSFQRLNDTIRASQEALEEDEQALARLERILELTGDTADETGDEISDAFRKASDSIDDLLRSIPRLQAQLSAARISDDALESVRVFQEAQDILEGLGEAEVAQIGESLREAGFEAEDVTRALQSALQEQDSLTQAIQEAVNAREQEREELERVREGIADLETNLSERLSLEERLAEASKLFADRQEIIKRVGEDQIPLRLSQEEIVRRILRAEIGIEDAARRATAQTELLNRAFEAGAITSDELKENLRQVRLELLESQETASAGAERFFIKLQGQVEDVASRTEELMNRAFQSAEDALVDFVNTGRFELTKFIQDIQNQLLRQAFRAVTASAAGSLGIGQSPQGSLIGSLFGNLGGLFGGAFNGADFTVGPSTSAGTTQGADNRLVAFRARDGERVQVSTPGQDRGRTPGTGQPQIVFNIQTPDADSFRRSEGQILARTQGMLQRAQRRNT